MRRNHWNRHHRMGLRGLLVYAVALFVIYPGWIVAEPQQTTVTETYRVAYDFGFRDGRAAGQADRASGGLYDLANKGEFQRAENGFDPSVHDREVYLVAYRRGFEDGYDDGYGLNDVSGVEPADVNQPASSTPADRRAEVIAAPRPDVPARSGTGSMTRLPPGTQVTVELRNTLSTRYSERGDSFRARTIRDVVLNQEVVIPRGSEITGEVSYVKRAGRVRGRSQLNLRFDRLRFPDGRETTLAAKVVGLEQRSAETVKTKGEEGTIVAPASKGEDAKSVGKASGLGALLGVLTGGKKGAAVGATAGAVAGLAGVLMTRGQDAVLESGTELTIELTSEADIPQ